jgi:hypothetical protein
MCQSAPANKKPCHSVDMELIQKGGIHHPQVFVETQSRQNVLFAQIEIGEEAFEVFVIFT